MFQKTIAHPSIVGRDEWLTARKTLLEHEKELTKHRDRINAERRRLPMVKLEKEYTFEGSNGPVKLIDLFAGRTQLIIYHFMFAPEWEKGCMGCTGYVNALGDLSRLNERDTTFVLIYTYSTYARGVESLTDTYSLLDVTPYGRQEDFEDSPSGWPQHPTYG
ncbi:MULTISPECIES: DUF899 family protein [unclassified Leptolyngbya]|uniref:DUF899 family protein n=1 Tax=unclassified Leptolyngbya TaxID=2650499 RepID=UPI001681F742|nr:MULTISPECIES: DUF899 family protein [unclassified Leptolyngbya]MBD1914093.1 DUF899 family protein [Leptolyngbya sp. FACHB-8]MBD2157310.1 DUF899 family protein [Leptolyngbya sp. FACHB-16]